MDIVTIGEVLIDLTQTGRMNAAFHSLRQTPAVPPPIWRLPPPSWAHRLPLSARWARMPLAAI